MSPEQYAKLQRANETFYKHEGPLGTDSRLINPLRKGGKKQPKINKRPNDDKGQGDVTNSKSC